MSANQETMRTTIKAADTTKVSAVITAVSNFQSKIATSGVQAGCRLGFPTGFATRQAAVFLAKDTLRSQGEYGY